MHHSAYSINKTEQGSEIAFQMVVQGDHAILERCQRLNAAFWANAQMVSEGSFSVQHTFQCPKDVSEHVVQHTAEIFRQSQLDIANISLTDAKNTEMYGTSWLPMANQLAY